MDIIYGSSLGFRSPHDRTKDVRGSRVVEVYEGGRARGKQERGDGTRCSYNEEVSNLTLLRVVLSSPYPSPPTYRVVLSPLSLLAL